MAHKHKKTQPDDPRKEQVVRIIEQAFRDCPYPGDGHIATNPHHCPECEQADAFFRTTHWQRLLLEHDRLPTGYASPCFLTPEAQRFFLPAYLIMGLDYYTTQSGADVGSFAIFLLTPSEANGVPLLADGFTIEQISAIRAFFDHLRETDPYQVNDAYDFSQPQANEFTRYWSDRAEAGNIA